MSGGLPWALAHGAGRPPSILDGKYTRNEGRSSRRAVLHVSITFYPHCTVLIGAGARAPIEVEVEV